MNTGTIAGKILWKLAGKLCWIVLLLLLLYFLLGTRRGQKKWKVLRRFRYAHRGLHRKPDVPENSLAAFRKAVEHGFGAELDVHLTADKRLAVIHDSSLWRTCSVPGNVEDFTAKELSRFRLEGTEEKIPFLEEVLPLFAGKTPLIVEIKPAKGNWTELTEATCAMLDRFPVEYCMESFDPRVLLWLKKYRPDVIRGQLAQDFLKEPSGLSLPHRFLLTNLLYNCRTRPDFIAYKFEDRRQFSLWFCRVFCRVQEVDWTIRSLKDMERAEALGNLVIFEGFVPDRTGKKHP